MPGRMLLFLIASLIPGCAENCEKDYSTANFTVVKLSEGVYVCIHKP